MSCSPFDLRDYHLKELPEAELRQVESHVRGCAACREELDRLSLTETALLALRDEEIPQRIAFVSDKIFEPSPWRRWLAGFWGSAARLGFASAAMLSAALVFHAATRPAPAPASVAAKVVSAGLTAADVDARIHAAVEGAVASSESRQAARTIRLVSELEQRARDERRMRQVAEWDLDRLERRTRTSFYTANRDLYGPPHTEGGAK